MTKIYGDISPLRNHVLIYNMEKGERITRGIIIADDNGKDRGIRPRWAQVYKVGSEVDMVSPGEWVFIEHGRWTHGVEVIKSESEEPLYVQRADVDAILLVSDERPEV